MPQLRCRTEASGQFSLQAGGGFMGSTNAGLVAGVPVRSSFNRPRTGCVLCLWSGWMPTVFCARSVRGRETRRTNSSAPVPRSCSVGIGGSWKGTSCGGPNAMLRRAFCGCRGNITFCCGGLSSERGAKPERIFAAAGTRRRNSTSCAATKCAHDTGNSGTRCCVGLRICGQGQTRCSSASTDPPSCEGTYPHGMFPSVGLVASSVCSAPSSRSRTLPVRLAGRRGLLRSIMSFGRRGGVAIVRKSRVGLQRQQTCGKRGPGGQSCPLSEHADGGNVGARNWRTRLPREVSGRTQRWPGSDSGSGNVSLVIARTAARSLGSWKASGNAVWPLCKAAAFGCGSRGSGGGRIARQRSARPRRSSTDAGRGCCCATGALSALPRQRRSGARCGLFVLSTSSVLSRVGGRSSAAGRTCGPSAPDSASRQRSCNGRCGSRNAAGVLDCFGSTAAATSVSMPPDKSPARVHRRREKKGERAGPDLATA
eukprot:Hpha_TRINITY_DN3223_c0_g1::TRINITY_DN3223_c0_g1_i1::g.185954::m.185954